MDNAGPGGSGGRLTPEERAALSAIVKAQKRAKPSTAIAVSAKKAARMREWEGPFLMGLRRHGLAAKAAENAGITLGTAYARRAADEGFKERWKEAQAEGIDRRCDFLEAALLKRGLEKSDQAAIAMLQGYRREVHKLRDSTVKATFNGCTVEVKSI